jgi:hypothetical protein
MKTKIKVNSRWRSLSLSLSHTHTLTHKHRHTHTNTHPKNWTKPKKSSFEKFTSSNEIKPEWWLGLWVMLEYLNISYLKERHSKWDFCNTARYYFTFLSFFWKNDLWILKEKLFKGADKKPFERKIYSKKWISKKRCSNNRPSPVRVLLLQYIYF